MVPAGHARVRRGDRGDVPAAGAVAGARGGRRLRLVRSMLHGFASLEHQGYLSHFDPPAEESYRFAIDRACEMLERAEELS
ncbi:MULTISPECIES: TetR-like C-terminal domain-containing protein [Enorma]|uniref:TetR-like C-terminal domain-containing protein n=1 Tax=Enorma TaxID=1472762 RepID=UPI002FC29B16